MLAAYDHPTLGAVRSVGLPLRVGDFAPTYRPGPALGGDQQPVLRGLGYSDAEIEALVVSGAFGSASATPPEGEGG